MNGRNNHSKTQLELLREGEGLRLLCIDLNGHTRYIFNDWTKSEEAGWDKYPNEQKRLKLIKLIERLRINYVVYERREIDLIPNRPAGDNGFINYIELKHWFINFLHRRGIAGAIIKPGETDNFIRYQTNWCWRDPRPQKQDDPKEQSPYYCKRHQLEAPCENWYPNKPIPINDEVDARAIYNIIVEREWLRDYNWIRERERIHWLEPKKAPRQNYAWEVNKSTREQYKARQQENGNGNKKN